ASALRAPVNSPGGSLYSASIWASSAATRLLGMGNGDGVVGRLHQADRVVDDDAVIAGDDLARDRRRVRGRELVHLQEAAVAVGAVALHPLQADHRLRR